MKYKDPKSGKVYSDIIQAVEAYKCPGPCNPDCPLCVVVGLADGRSVLKCHHDWAGSHPVQVSNLIGYEILDGGITVDEKKIYRAALDKWGAEAQTLMVMEEMAELQEELCKHARGKDNRCQIAEEIADVQIMLEQMMLLHGCEQEAADYRIIKLLRLKEMVEGTT